MIGKEKNGLSCELIGVIKAGMHQLEAAICFDDIAWAEALLKGAISCREEMKIDKNTRCFPCIDE